MYLAVDIGNSRTKCGVFDNNELIERFNYDSFKEHNIESIFNNFPDVTEVIISNVTTSENFVNFFSRQNLNPLILSHKTPIPIINKYESPETLGSDRLAGMVGANSLFPKSNILLINAGTCLTIDFLNENNEYIGGSISPGINTRFKALHTFTANLPLLSIEDVQQEMTGRNTTNSIRSGIMNGILGEVQYFIGLYCIKFPDINVVLTGGDAWYFDKNLKSTIFVDSCTVLKGLNEILKYNLDNPKV